MTQALVPGQGTTLQIAFPQMSKLQTEAAAAPRILALANDIPVTNSEQAAIATATLQDLLRCKDALEKERTDVTGPLHKTKAWIDAQYRPVSQCLQSAVDIIKAKVGSYNLLLQAEKDAQFQAAQQAHAEGNHQQMAEALNQSSAIQTAAPAGASIRETWEAEVFNPSIVPHEFLMVDYGKIQAHARGTLKGQEPAPIPGVRFVKKAQVAIYR